MNAQNFKKKLLKELRKSYKIVDIKLTVIYHKKITVKYHILTANDNHGSINYSGYETSYNLTRALSKCLKKINNQYEINIKL